MDFRIPNPHSPEEVRRAFGRLKAPFSILDEGAAGEVLVGAGVGSVPVWGTELTALTKVTVDNITLDATTITSDTGAIGFGDENLTTTGTITGINVTSGENPGHTHTGASLSGIDISDDTNLAAISPIVLTDDTLSLDQSAVDHGSIGGLADDDHSQYHTDGRAATWLAANHETTYNHAHYDTAYGWGDHASGGYLKANGTVALTGDWATGAFSFIGSEHWYLRADNKKMYWGTGNDASIYYSGSHLMFNSQEYGGGDFHFLNGNMYFPADSQKCYFGEGYDASICYNGTDLVIESREVGTGDVRIPNGRLGIGTPYGPDFLLDTRYFTDDESIQQICCKAQITFGSSGSGDMTNKAYAQYFAAQTDADYDGDFTGSAFLAGVNGVATHYGSGTLAKMYGGMFQVHLASGAGNVTRGYALRAYTSDSSSVGQFTYCYGLYVEDVNIGSGSNNWAIYTKEGYVYHEGSVGINVAYPDEKLEVHGHIHLDDNYKSKYGTGKDATIYYDDTNLIIDPDEAGSGVVKIGATADDTIDAGSYSVAGAAGASGTFTTVDGKTVTVTNGIITAIV